MYLAVFGTAANRPIALLKPLLSSSALWHEACYRCVSVYLLDYFNSLIPGRILSEDCGCNDSLYDLTLPSIGDIRY